jgi:hypothetical protein
VKLQQLLSESLWVKITHSCLQTATW